MSAVLILLIVLPLAAVVVATGALLVFGVAEVGSRVERAAQDDSVRARGEALRVTTDLVDRLDQVRAVIGADSRASASLLDSVEQAHRSQAVAVAVVAASGLSGAAMSGPVAALVVLTPIALSDAWVGLADIGGARAQAAEVRLARVLDQQRAVTDWGERSMPSGVLPVTADGIRAAWSDEQTPLGPFTLAPLEPGAYAQLTGPNGIGKSTMLAVLARQLTPVSGTHLLAGVPAADVCLADARADIAIVDDEPHAFAGSIRANLALAAPDATDDDVIESLAAADLTGWFNRQPDGLNTLLTGLSGGERTRLSIARAVLSRRRLVLLDEPAAHLDEATAARALRRLLTDPAVTVVAVSHQPLPIVSNHGETKFHALGGVVGGHLDEAVPGRRERGAKPAPGYSGSGMTQG